VWSLLALLTVDKVVLADGDQSNVDADSAECSSSLHQENIPTVDSIVKVYDDVLSVDAANWFHTNGHTLGHGGCNQR
jgi:hypothetical protein